jgi:hypothetical protein
MQYTNSEIFTVGSSAPRKIERLFIVANIPLVRQVVMWFEERLSWNYQRYHDNAREFQLVSSQSEKSHVVKYTLHVTPQGRH